LAIKGADDQQKQILELFQAKAFVPTEPGNYQQIEDVAKRLGLLR
jgi:ABC-type phosphate/phosphonate transport system substrate-binding protein